MKKREWPVIRLGTGFLRSIPSHFHHRKSKNSLYILSKYKNSKL
ncbi:hypothetical protein YPPY72_2002 [Yersinia pestis PY-72]|nr:hypothetical protein YPPY02_1871 [Yersinia pestis PY-02]EIR07777.1 hypothetical protein YPPY06_1948 [Yersinia pestis PY-06]EIS79899.1 hypothetical protein YPPY72_2002 [Yersinia pestis PY-72]EIS97127.1 hypothetical protein YPPY89_2100 [Yersinia pestis PY-89]